VICVQGVQGVQAQNTLHNFYEMRIQYNGMFAKMTPDTPDRSDTNHPGAWEIS